MGDGGGRKKGGGNPSFFSLLQVLVLQQLNQRYRQNDNVIVCRPINAM